MYKQSIVTLKKNSKKTKWESILAINKALKRLGYPIETRVSTGVKVLRNRRIMFITNKDEPEIRTLLMILDTILFQEGGFSTSYDPNVNVSGIIIHDMLLSRQWKFIGMKNDIQIHWECKRSIN